jgi:hypothetical protein
MMDNTQKRLVVRMEVWRPSSESLRTSRIEHPSMVTSSSRSNMVEFPMGVFTTVSLNGIYVLYVHDGTNAKPETRRIVISH